MHKLFGGRKRRGDWSYEDFLEYAQYSGDSEVVECCHDYSIDILWGVAALVKFVELLRAEEGGADVRAG